MSVICVRPGNIGIGGFSVETYLRSRLVGTKRRPGCSEVSWRSNPTIKCIQAFFPCGLMRAARFAGAKNRVDAAELVGEVTRLCGPA